MAHISVVIPVYQAQGCLAELGARLVGALSAITSDFEVILIDDGSSDGSWAAISKLAHDDSRIVGYRLSRNFGQHFALTAGLDVCDGDWVVTMDCDLQDRPEDIRLLYAAATAGHDVVLARRRQRRGHPVRRLVARGFYKSFAYLADLPYDGAVGNFRMISRPVAENTRLLREQARFIGGIVWWLGYSVAVVDVENDPRFAGRSSYDNRKLAKLAIDMILAYSDKPLRLTVRFGLLIALFAMLFGAYFFVRALVYTIPVSGWASLIVSFYMLGGITIGLLGVIGLYLSRVFEESKRRPLYVIRDSTPKSS